MIQHKKTPQDDQNIRIDKYLSSLGVSSRRNIQLFLSKNIILVNGIRVLKPGTRISKSQIVLVNGKRLKKPRLVYYIVNKPKGIISTASDEYNRKIITDLVKTRERIFPVGRLDQDTTGLVILTNDGELTNLLTHPRFHIPKTYRLKTKLPVLSEQLSHLRNGVLLDDGKTQEAKVRLVRKTSSNAEIEIVIYEGKKRQIRRMCEKVGLKLLELKRIKIGSFEFPNLKEGDYLKLTQRDVQKLRSEAYK